jgi:hypothetical protein
MFDGTLNQTNSSVHVGMAGLVAQDRKLTATTHSIALARLLQVLVCSIDLYNSVSLFHSQSRDCSGFEYAGQVVPSTLTLRTIEVDKISGRIASHTIELIREGVVILGLGAAGACTNQCVNYDSVSVGRGYGVPARTGVVEP